LSEADTQTIPIGLTPLCVVTLRSLLARHSRHSAGGGPTGAPRGAPAGSHPDPHRGRAPADRRVSGFRRFENPTHPTHPTTLAIFFDKLPPISFARQCFSFHFFNIGFGIHIFFPAAIRPTSVSTVFVRLRQLCISTTHVLSSPNAPVVLPSARTGHLPWRWDGRRQEHRGAGPRGPGPCLRPKGGVG